ncbi:Mannosyl-glycoprotein endo-beta-N-acetylglucosamidase-like domain containing protein [uncultured Caudovirales phage]|uniref:Mannosyl-glycoprotein endo-beta-N-acetylglucosamidase-like domain containing protein n=1 Tax=uncultured Caudovirales phage TaxID=2100421 RepID=A0A6J5RLS1_9CAUD|nr:Mannosyl-glycoprotein endo-beta-N-acetylglucosamidase-like domain containing protein [uncultured Caudovirales phage]
MSATLVPTIKTSYNGTEMIEGFIKGWFNQFNIIPKKESVGVIWSQNAIETGSTTSMWNNNIGNVKFVPSSNQDDDNDKQYMMLANVWEIISGKKVIYQPPHQATWFRAFPTLEDGVGFHLDFLKNHRYRNAWAAVEAGDPAQFAHLLKVAKYYTAPEIDYVNAMNSYFKKFMKDKTFENVVLSLQPKLNVNADNTVTVSGDIDLATQPTTNVWDIVVDTLSKK